MALVGKDDVAAVGQVLLGPHAVVALVLAQFLLALVLLPRVALVLVLFLLLLLPLARFPVELAVPV